MGKRPVQLPMQFEQLHVWIESLTKNTVYILEWNLIHIFVATRLYML